MNVSHDDENNNIFIIYNLNSKYQKKKKGDQLKLD